MTHAATIAKYYTNKHCDIYLGETASKILYSDHEVEQFSLVRGMVVKADGEMLIVRCEVNSAGGKSSVDIMINGWVIKSIMEHTDAVSLLRVMNTDEQKRRKR